MEPSVPTTQACCLPDGTCSMQLPGECSLAGGAPGAPGSTCANGACKPTKTHTQTWGALKSVYR